WGLEHPFAYRLQRVEHRGIDPRRRRDRAFGSSSRDDFNRGVADYPPQFGHHRRRVLSWKDADIEGGLSLGRDDIAAEAAMEDGGRNGSSQDGIGAGVVEAKVAVACRRLPGVEHSAEAGRLL